MILYGGTEGTGEPGIYKKTRKGLHNWAKTNKNKKYIYKTKIVAKYKHIANTQQNCIPCYK